MIVILQGFTSDNNTIIIFIIIAFIILISLPGCQRIRFLTITR